MMVVMMILVVMMVMTMVVKHLETINKITSSAPGVLSERPFSLSGLNCNSITP